MLHVLAARIQGERDLHDLRIKTIELRKSHSVRIAALRAQDTEVIEVDEAEPPTVAPLGKAA